MADFSAEWEWVIQGVKGQPSHAVACKFFCWCAATTHEHVISGLPTCLLLQAGDYNVSQLRAAFAGHGVVEDVVLREGKKKGSALVVMATQEAAAAAAGAVCGDMDNPLLVIPFPKVKRSRSPLLVMSSLIKHEKRVTNSG